MIKTSKKILKKILPDQVMSAYHFCLAQLAALIYGFPSSKMHVIGVTGTKGKTSTVNFIWSTLNAGGYKTGIISTANIRIGDHEDLNHFHMTMPGRFTIQKFMKEMVEAGCTHCVIETTSEGIKQHRHIGVAYDCVIFTNLTPEHLPSHGGSFEKYKQTKGEIFRRLHTLSPKKLNGKTIDKVIIANTDSEHAPYYMSFEANQKISYGVTSNSADFRATDIKETTTGVDFSVTSKNLNNKEQYKLSILGAFNVFNALPAIAFCRQIMNIPQEKVRIGLEKLNLIPGRMEKIEEGQNFTLIVDYAHEKESMTNVMKTATAMRTSGKIIVLLGAEGGGRDKAKRPAMGEVVGKMADYVIVSNVDPYEDDPLPIIEDIAKASENAGKIRNQNLFTIPDRREGIRKALNLAQANDIVIITGKGAEQSMLIGGQEIPWDDRKVVKEELKAIAK